MDAASAASAPGGVVDLPDGSMPPPRRRRALEAAYNRNMLLGRRPYDHVRIETLGEYLWILLRRDWPGGIVSGNLALGKLIEWFSSRRARVAQGRSSALRQPLADFRAADFSATNLEWADLGEADMRVANLASARLRHANLEHTLLTDADLDGADLLDPGRVDVLETHYERCRGTPTPYGGVEIATRAELLFIMRRRGWSGNPDPHGQQRANLRSANLLRLDMQCVDLVGADLTNAILIAPGRASELPQPVPGQVPPPGRGPLEGIRLRSANEIAWILRAFGWTGDPGADASSRPDLRGVDLSEAHVAGVYLHGANLLRARLQGADLHGARLIEATSSSAGFDGADLRHADLTGALCEGAGFYKTCVAGATFDQTRLVGAPLYELDGREASFLNAILSNAVLYGAHLNGATLRLARLDGTDLRNADLTDADMREVQLDARTQLADAQLDADTWLGGINWNVGVSLIAIDWEKMGYLGDEQLLLKVPDVRISNRDRLRNLRLVAQAYQGLSVELKKQGVGAAASAYRFRQQQLLQRIARLEGRRLTWLVDGMLDVVVGYGERPSRTLKLYVILVLGFAEVYYFMGQSSGPRLTLWDFIAFSVATFHGRGFFPNPVDGQGILLGNWITHLGIVEALIGVFIEFTFIAAYAKRFLVE